MNFIQKYQMLPIQIKTTIWFTLCNFAVKGMAFIAVPLFTRLMSTEEYGIVTIYNSYQQVLLIIATLELSLGAYNRGYLMYQDQLSQFTTALLIVSTINTCLLFILIFPFRQQYYFFTGSNLLIYLLTFIMFILQPAYNCWLCGKRYKYDYKPAVIITLIYTAATTFIPLCSLMIIKSTATLKITTTLFAQIIIFFPLYLYQLKIRKDDFGVYKKISKFLLSYQLPLLFHALSFLILGQADRIMIGHMVGKSEAAIYSVAYSIGQMIIIFQSSLNQVFQPYRFKKMEKREWNEINKTTNAIILFIFIIVILFMLVVPEVIMSLFTKDYSETIEILPPIIVSVFFIFIYNIFSDVEAYFNKTSYIMYATIISAVINIVLNYFGILFFGYKICAYTTLICYMALTVIHYIFVRKICKNEKITEGIYDFKFIFIFGTVCVGLTLAVNANYHNWILRYIIVAVILFILKKNQSRILSLYASMK